MQLKAGKEYHRKTSRPHQMWATDASYFRVIGWGLYYLVTVMDDDISSKCRFSSSEAPR